MAQKRPEPENGSAGEEERQDEEQPRHLTFVAVGQPGFQRGPGYARLAQTTHGGSRFRSRRR